MAVLGSPRTGRWLAVEELFDAELPSVLAAVEGARGTGNLAVAGALLFEQYAQRLVAPVLASLLRDGEMHSCEMSAVRVEVVQGVLRRLAFACPPRSPRGQVAWTDVAAALVSSNLDPLAEAVHRYTRVGERVLRGSMAAAMVSALLHMSWPKDDHAFHALDAQELLLTIPGFKDLVNLDVVQVAGERWMYFERNTCCLAFRTAANQARDQPYCSACPMLSRTTIMRLFERATASYSARRRSLT